QLSALYFDIRKDRLYCDRPDMFERRAYRSVMAAIFEALCGWLAPVICFTSDEAWSFRPQGLKADAQDSIHLHDFVNTPDAWVNEKLATKWQQVIKVRDVVLGALEIARKDKMIGSALEAHPVISMPEEVAGIDWAEICITSQASVKKGELAA